MEETVKDVGEFGLIDRIAKDLIYRPELVVIDSGDDGAVYRVPAGYDQVISTDTMVEGIHFIKKTMRPSDVGYKLCASNFSDMAAMGADAIGFVISAALPEQLPVSWVESLYEGIRECCASYRVNLLGGDVTGSPSGVILTGTVVGMALSRGAGHALAISSLRRRHWVTRPPDSPRSLRGFRKSIPLYVSATSGRVRRSSSAAHSEQPERHL